MSCAVCIGERGPHAKVSWWAMCRMWARKALRPVQSNASVNDNHQTAAPSLGSSSVNEPARPLQLLIRNRTRSCTDAPGRRILVHTSPS